MAYALVQLEPLAFVREMESVANCKSTHVIVPIVQEPQPSYNAATQKLAPNRTVASDQVTYGWSIIELTDAEIAKRELAEGYAVSPEGFTLLATEKAQLTYTSFASLLQAAVVSGSKTTNDEELLHDSTNQPHTLTIGRILAILEAYGFWCLDRVRTIEHGD